MTKNNSKRPGWADSMIAVQKGLQSNLKLKGQRKNLQCNENEVKCNNSQSVTDKGTNDTQA